MYEESYSICATETLDGIGRFREFRRHSTVAFLARRFKMKGLEILALGLLRSQLQSERPPGEDCIREMYSTRDHEARRIVVTEAAELYLKLPALAEILHEAAHEVGDFEVDLIKVSIRRDCR